MGQFVYVIRKRIKLAPEKAIFIFVDDEAFADLLTSQFDSRAEQDSK